MNPQPHSLAPTPWWRVGMVWLVLSGPAIVVVAGFVTLKIAMTHVDPVIQEPPAATGPMTSAVKARNHAASPKP
ncbi:MAG: nitrogen fixation protein FixH [Rhizobacter sp.]